MLQLQSDKCISEMPSFHNGVTRRIATGPIPVDDETLAHDVAAADSHAHLTRAIARWRAFPVFGGTAQLDPPQADDGHQGEQGGPFGRSVARYRAAGLAGVFPLPAHRKSPPVTGYTGKPGKCADDDQVDAWLSDAKHHDANIGLWLGITVLVSGVKYQVVGIDVDHYTSGTGEAAKPKLGGDQLAALETELGPLPQTWISSARTDGLSGIRFFLAPHGIEFRDRADKDIEVIQRKHRYAVVWPSCHPGDDEIPPGRAYWWFPPGVSLTDAGRRVWTETADLPNVAELPVLPDAWRVYLSTHRSHDGQPDYSVSVSELRQWAVDMFNDGDADDMCWNVANAVATWKRLITNEATSHDKITDAHWMLFRLAAEGHTGWKAAVDAVEQHWANDVMARGKRTLTEVRAEAFRSWTGALRKIKVDVSRGGTPAECDCASGGAHVWHSDRVPLGVARQLALLAERDERPIHRWRGDWYQYDGSRWKRLDDDQFAGMLYAVLEPARYKNKLGDDVPWNPDESKIRKVAHAMRSVVLLDSEVVNAPCWLDGTAHSVIACRNGLVRLADRALIDHTPRYFNTSVLAFDFDPNAPEPRRWIDFVGEIFDDDDDSVAALQEWFGYVLSGRTDLQKMLMMVGPTRSGKGTVDKILEALIGRENHAGLTARDITDTFGLQSLTNKSLGVFGDERMTVSGKRLVEILLGIVGEDVQTVKRKYQGDWIGRLPLRLMFMSNELPTLPDSSGAIVGRMILLETCKSWLGNEDQMLTADLMAELPGIFNWSLDGLARVSRQGRFTDVNATAGLVKLLHESASPIKQFVDEKCVLNPEKKASKDHMYQVWREWCRDNGHDAGSKVSLSKKLVAAFGRGVINPDKRVGGRDGQVRSFGGIAIRPVDSSAPSGVFGPLLRVVGAETTTEAE